MKEKMTFEHDGSGWSLAVELKDKEALCYAGHLLSPSGVRTPFSEAPRRVQLWSRGLWQTLKDEYAAK